jgi:RNA-directed DNA polymerase
MTLVEGSISDSRVLALIDGFLQQEIISDVARWQPTTGTPQGAVLSPLLANLYLHPLDELMAQSGYQMVRYADQAFRSVWLTSDRTRLACANRSRGTPTKRRDDFVILCASEAEATAALRQVTAWVNANGLTLQRADRLWQHRSASRLDPDKTRVGDAAQPGQGFDFPGYRFEAGRRFVREKSPRAFKDKLRARTIRSRGDSLERIIADINPLLRGWFEYFKHARSRLFRRIDQIVRRRLRAILRKQEKRPSMGRSEADHSRWTNAFFADQGLFTLLAAHEHARYPR